MSGTLTGAGTAYRALRRMKNTLLNRVDAPMIVLGYHRVAEKASDPHQLSVSPENFRHQMGYLRDRCRIVRLEEEWSNLKERAVAVTFDDGYADNLGQALPILEETGVPATFFISTWLLHDPGRTASRTFWWDELGTLVLGGERRPTTFRLKRPPETREWCTGTPEERRAFHDELHALFFELPAVEREACLEQLRDWAGEGNPGEVDRLLTGEEVRALAESPWAEIGAHTVSHPRLSLLAEEAQRNEITASKRQLEALVGREVRTFAYPFGSRRDFDGTSVRLCREAGFQRAVSTIPGQVHRWTDACRLPRQLVRNWDAATFAARLESFWT